jgi:hypothetical protein
VLKKKIWANFQRIMELFTQKIVTKLSKIWIWDPGSGKNLFRIPDPGVKKAPDPGSGSATLLIQVVIEFFVIFQIFRFSKAKIIRMAKGPVFFLTGLNYNSFPQKICEKPVFLSNFTYFKENEKDTFHTWYHRMRNLIRRGKKI